MDYRPHQNGGKGEGFRGLCRNFCGGPRTVTLLSRATAIAKSSHSEIDRDLSRAKPVAENESNLTSLVKSRERAHRQMAASLAVLRNECYTVLAIGSMGGGSYDVRGNVREVESDLFIIKEKYQYAWLPRAARQGASKG